MKNAVFWDVALSVLTKTTWRHIPEDRILYTNINLLILLAEGFNVDFSPV
jgi:hypothetical protein